MGLFQVPRLLLPLSHRPCTQHSESGRPSSHWSVDPKPELWLVQTSWPRPASHWPVPRGFWPLIGCRVAGLKLLHLAHTGHIVPESDHYINTRGMWHGQQIRLQRWEPLCVPSLFMCHASSLPILVKAVNKKKTFLLQNLHNPHCFVISIIQRADWLDFQMGILSRNALEMMEPLGARQSSACVISFL